MLENTFYSHVYTWSTAWSTGTDERRAAQTLCTAFSPHLSPGLCISSLICQGYLEDRKQDICRESVMAAVLFLHLLACYCVYVSVSETLAADSSLRRGGGTRMGNGRFYCVNRALNEQSFLRLRTRNYSMIQKERR